MKEATMALKLSKEEKKDRQNHLDAIEGAKEALQTALDTYNAAVKTAWEPVRATLDSLEEKRQAAEGWAHDVGTRIEDEIADKSEKWLESDRGSNAQSFQSDYEGFSLEGWEMEDPEDIECPDIPEDVFDGLPEEVE